MVSDWCRRGFLHAEQKSALDPRWIRLTEEDLARLDGKRAAQGYGRWRLREAQRVSRVTAGELYQRVRDGELIAYRAHTGNHWEWRVDPADGAWQKEADQPIGLQTASEEVK